MKDTSVIPKGPYCYDEKICPYWKRIDPPKGLLEWLEIEDEDPDTVLQDGYGCGYCAFLEKSDWDLAQESTLVNMKTGEKVKGTDLPFMSSRLWDQCKECGIHFDDGVE